MTSTESVSFPYVCDRNDAYKANEESMDTLTSDIGLTTDSSDTDDNRMWDNRWDFLDAATECQDCPGPPPEFLLPPPPRPPSLQPANSLHCTDDPMYIETCDALPLIDASYRSSPSSQTLAVIVLCSVLLGLLVFITIILVWKHKRVQNLLPCKNSPQNNCDRSASTGLYEDLSDVMPRHTPAHHHHLHQLASGHIVAPQIEMIDVKNNVHYPSGFPISNHPPVFLCHSPGPDPYCSQDLYNPVYEELSDNETDILERQPCGHSEDEFAEDELSLHGADVLERRRLEAGPPPYREVGNTNRQRRGRIQHEPLPPIPNNRSKHRSLDRRRHEFHEGMLLDALLQLYPRVGSIAPPSNTTNHPQSRRPIPSIAQNVQYHSIANHSPSPYDTMNIASLATFRPVPKPHSQDSALGSDSGYSNHTSGTSGYSHHTLNRGRREPRRLSNISADLGLT